MRVLGCYTRVKSTAHASEVIVTREGPPLAGTCTREYPREVQEPLLAVLVQAYMYTPPSQHMQFETRNALVRVYTADSKILINYG